MGALGRSDTPLPIIVVVTPPGAIDPLPRKSRLPAAKRREQLLDCAAQLFAVSGYARATTAELARAAGVTEPIIYRHFASKRDLFVALIERAAKQTIDRWEEQLADAKDSAERLRILLGKNPMVSDAGRYAYRVIIQSITEIEDREIHKAVNTHIKELHAFLVRELTRAQGEHRVTGRFSPEIIAWLLIHAALGYGVLDAMKIAGQGEDDAGTHIQDVITRILVGPKHDHA